MMMDKNEIEKNWTEKGFSFGIGTIKANDGINEAFHDDKDELVRMESGKYEFKFGEEIFLQEGEVDVLIPAGTKHSIKNLGTEDAVIYYGYRTID